MKKIGEGFYYNVFDVGNNRVLKTKTSPYSRMRKLIKWGRTEDLTVFDILNPYKINKKFIESIRASKKAVEVIGLELFGNPLFVSSLEYTQDKAQLMSDTLFASSFEDQKKLIQEYIDGVYILWQYGFSDTVFNFLWNNGVSLQTGKLLFIDFNEFTTNKEKVIRDIEKKKWTTQSSLNLFPDTMPELKGYIINAFNTAFTEDMLEKLWEISIIDKKLLP